MPLLQSYTLSFVDNQYKKICIDFTDTKPSSYELASFVKYFRKHKSKVFIEKDKDNIYFIVIHWKFWIEYLLKMRFRDTAKACTEILEDLRHEFDPTPDEWFDMMKDATILKDVHKEKSEVDDKKDDNEYEKEKYREILRLQKNKNELEKEKLINDENE